LILETHGERSAAVFEALDKNDKALRTMVHSFDFDFLPVPRLLLTAWGYDFNHYTDYEVNPITGSFIYWTYSLGVEWGKDREEITIRFRHGNGDLWHT
jgi:hypothetical protein